MATPEEEKVMDEERTVGGGEVPVHGVLAVEGVETGDRRRFAEGALTWRDLPLPLLWQKASSDGHAGATVVGRIERIARAEDGSLPWSGFMNTTTESDEVTGLVADRSLRGVSVDVDNATMELQSRSGAALSEDVDIDPDDVVETLTKARISAATICAIPAFAEAYIALGPGTRPEGGREEVAGDYSSREFRDVSQKERDDLESEGKAMDDGSFPIANVEDLKNAIQSVGRAKDPEKARAHIKKRAKALGESDLIPDEWSAETFSGDAVAAKSVQEIVQSLPVRPDVVEQLLAADEADLPDAVASVAEAIEDPETAEQVRAAADQIRDLLSPTGAMAEESAPEGAKASIPGLPDLSEEEAARISAASPEDVPDVLEEIAAEVGEGEKADLLRRAAAAMREAIGNSEAPPTEASASTSEFADLAPGLTEDGPGWLTHPVETDRLRDYWTHGIGAAKIGWGLPGDFYRCRALTVQYVGPRHINGYCANRHKDALGIWPGQHNARTITASAGEPVAPAYRLVASGGPSLPPMDWFANPGLQEPTPLTITEDGQVFGHVATWGTCHVGFEDSCVTAPSSASEYAYFCSGVVATDGGDVRAGQITFDTGHAGLELNSRRTMAHYDNTGHCAADVMAGEDEIGIWVAGALRPGISDEQMRTLRGAKMSGDWRSIGGNLEMVAVLAVNVPGFPIPRPALAASGGRSEALVAAGVVPETKGVENFTVEEVVSATLAKIEADRAAREEIQRISAALAAEDIERTVSSVQMEG